MKRELVLAIAAALLAASGTAFALTDTETNASIPFNLANPGARSMGMGGAFVGLADDATAAYTNPAGLTQLIVPEVSAEGRHTDYSLPYVNGGSATISPFNGSGLHTSDADSSKNNVSFLSFVYPHERWSFAFYRDELVRFGNDFSTDLHGESVTGFADGSTTFAFPISARTNLKIDDYGFAVAWKASDVISLGAGISYYDFDIDTSIQRFTFTGIEQYRPGISAGIPLNSQTQNGSDNDVGINLGARFVLTETLSAGVTYRRGPEFSYAANNVAVTGLYANGDGTYHTGAPDSSGDVHLKNVRFN